MTRLTFVLATAVFAGCSSAPTPVPTPAPAAPRAPIQVQDQARLDPVAQARADGGKPPFIEADLKFMRGMIHHHAQAILISKWAPGHGASESLQKLCARIVVAQRDEINLMSTWLRQRNQDTPVADTLGTGEHAGHNMPGMAMPGPTLMPGMLTPAQVAQLDSARGREFDRLFLRYMIQHHQGAILMVNELLATYGAAQDGVVSRFAADVVADQGAEIERMTLMLNAIPAGRSPSTSREAHR